MSEPLREFAVSIVRTLRAAGHESLFAGGCVRDMLLGHPPSDYDVATSATPEVVMSLFRRTLPVGVSFGVVRVLGPKLVGEVEVATFRSDGQYLDGRRPESVTFGNARADAERRDFTINGMFLDPITDEVIDNVGGREDLQRGLIRAIGDPRHRFAEDKLRLLRAIRFAARLGFVIEPETWSAIVAMAPEVTQDSVERIAQEMRRMLVDPRRAAAMNMTRSAGLLAAILPEIDVIATLARPSPLHPGDTMWDATLRTLDALPDRPSFPLAMAAMVGGHGGGGKGVAALARRWKLATAECERIAWLHEHRAALVAPESMRRSALKRLLAEPGIDDLLALHRAEAEATTGDVRPVLYCESYLRNEPDGPINPPPLLTGRDLIEAGLKPGPEFSLILEQVRDVQLDGAIATKEEAVRVALHV